jgi:Spy/CpxP family protein refolding chaperone
MKLFILISAIIVAGFKAEAKEQGREKDRSEFFYQKTVKELALTKEQQEKFRAMHDAGKGELKAKRKEMKAAHEEVEKALQGSASDDEVKAKFTVLQQKQDEFAKARLAKVLSVRALLTPEQRAKMKLMPMHHEKKKWRRQESED